MQLPSKELLREVLNKDYNDRFVDWFQIEDDNYLRTYYDCGKFDEQGRPTGLGIEINIYELAHKCKKWALINGFDIIVVEIDNKYKILAPDCWQQNKLKQDMNFIVSETFKAQDTELEAIFQACQWILDNKDN